MDPESTGPTLAQFTALCAEILGLGGLSAEANFFDVGGDSIAAARLAVEADERWGVDVDMLEAFTAPTIGALWSAMCEVSGVG